MKMSIKFMVIIAFVLSVTFVPLFAQHQIPEEFCINNDELKLYNLINNYRKEHKLPEIALSKNLCFVAKLHVSDLQYHRPDTADCNLHSWSADGDWTECCYGRDKFNNTCMTSKPKELTTYPGNGYEIAFWESVDAIPEVVLDLWNSSSASNDLILNKNIWKDKSWKAFGVGILKGYAVVWFGAEADVEEGVKICNSGEMAGRLIDKVKLNENAHKSDTQKYYLIIASFADDKTAQAEVAKYKSKGFRNPSVVRSGDNFRVSLGNYPNQEEALAAKKRLNEKYKDAWILKD